MSKPALPSAQFRHVVFPTDVERRKKVINFSAQGEVSPAAAGAEPPLSGENRAFVYWLLRLAGLDGQAYRPETLQRRLPACLRGLRARSVAEARRRVEDSPGLVAEAVSALLVGVTSFFRDPPVFDALERDVLPRLVQGRPGLYVWSAGCSDGAELYSLGMLFAERQWLVGSYFLGTDCRADAIRQARAGFFDPPTFRNVPPHLHTRYFTADGNRWRIVAPLRAALRWREADLLQTQEVGFWDLILCRNMTMYLRPEVANLLWPRFEALLRPGGVLVLGKAERPVGVKRLSQVGPCLYRRNRG